MTPSGLSRRLAIRRGLAAVVAGSSCVTARGSVADWMPYHPDEIVRIEPSLPNGGRGITGMRRIEPVLRDFRPAIAMAWMNRAARHAKRRQHQGQPPESGHHPPHTALQDIM